MKRVVLKVGSAVLTQNGNLAIDRLKNLVAFLSEAHKEYEIILVSSGAVAAGFTLLKLDRKNIANRQALAAIGQPLLMRHYKENFKKNGIICSQVLLIADDFDSRKRTNYAKNAIEILLQNKVLPIINENDVTATEELVFGDNDTLAAHVAFYFNADMLIILTDIDGYYDKNPKEFNDATMLKKVSFIEEKELCAPHNPNTEFATGGIVTKLQAAHFLLKHNKKMFLTSGFDLTFVKDFLLHNKQTKGTLFEK
jgi:glutamate 5-kinase